jgi:hypothetical protein
MLFNEYKACLFIDMSCCMKTLKGPEVNTRILFNATEVYGDVDELITHRILVFTPENTLTCF